MLLSHHRKILETDCWTHPQLLSIICLVSKLYGFVIQLSWHIISHFGKGKWTFHESLDQTSA